jgi:rRNA maturation RNase YbeY
MRLPVIAVRNLQRKTSLNIPELQRFAANAVKCCLQLHKSRRTDLCKLREIFIWLISDWRISGLHRKFLGKTGPTDVITFQDGEIFISVETAGRYARQFGNSLMREIKLDIVHGLLHLHGFDDTTQAAAKRMRNAEDRVLRCAR